MARAQPGAAPAAPWTRPVALLMSPAGLGTGSWHALSQLLPAWDSDVRVTVVGGGWLGHSLSTLLWLQGQH